jgi:predicted dehydrogenase
VRLTALVDRDMTRATELAKFYKVEKVLGDASELDTRLVDAVLVATPPFHHAPCCIDLVERGLHVLVEKPMAVNLEQAKAMVRAAEEAGVVLSVGLFRRLVPCTRLAKGVLDSAMLGRPLGFEVEEGEVYEWMSATLGNMRKDLAGGGVLIDYGSHTIDRLLFLFPGPAEVLEYRDNSHGGVESDCVLRLRLSHQGTPVEGRVELSRTRNLRNAFRVRCEKGTLEFRSRERYKLWIRLGDKELVDPFQGRPRDYALELRWPDQPEEQWYGDFRTQIDDWLGAIRTGRQPHLNGRSALAAVKLIEEAYRRVQPLDEPWARTDPRNEITS